MISVLRWWSFCFYICNVQRTENVRIFNNIITEPSTMSTRYVPSVRSKTCLLKPELGPCRSRISMWYFNPSSRNCSNFDWGGCQGNGNRFDSYDECQDFCLSKPGKYRPKYCSLTFDYGFCFGASERWFFDARWKVCKTTIYSGCGGNKNNFYNKEQCDQICRFGNKAFGRITTEYSPIRKVVVINPATEGRKRNVVLEGPPASNTSVPAG